MDLAVLDGEFVVGKPEFVLEPVEKCGLEDSAAAEKVLPASQTSSDLRKRRLARGFELLPQLIDADDFAQAHGRGAIDEREGGARAGKFFQMNWSMRSL